MNKKPRSLGGPPRDPATVHPLVAAASRSNAQISARLAVLAEATWTPEEMYRLRLLARGLGGPVRRPDTEPHPLAEFDDL